MLPTKFQFIWQSGFREDFLEINQSETRIAFHLPHFLHESHVFWLNSGVVSHEA
jgi:hypothetical protein